MKSIVFIHITCNIATALLWATTEQTCTFISIMGFNFTFSDNHDYKLNKRREAGVRKVQRKIIRTNIYCDRFEWVWQTLTWGTWHVFSFLPVRMPIACKILNEMWKIKIAYWCRTALKLMKESNFPRSTNPFKWSFTQPSILNFKTLKVQVSQSVK